MAFSNINYNFNDLEEARSLADVVVHKFAAFSKYLHGNEAVTCDVEFSKVASQQNGQIYRFEVTILIDGVLFRADATEESFEKAIDEVRGEIDKELRRAKDKQHTLKKRGGRELKEQLLEVTE